MTKTDLKRTKKKIFKCLTEDFGYGRTKAGKPLKRPRQNQALFSIKTGHQVFNGTDLTMIMDAVVLGLYFAMEESPVLDRALRLIKRAAIDCSNCNGNSLSDGYEGCPECFDYVKFIREAE